MHLQLSRRPHREREPESTCSCPQNCTPGRLLHDLTVVEIAAWLLDQDSQATWSTEREWLREQLKKVRELDGRLRRGPGRRPDRVLVRQNRNKEAVEVALTPKRDRSEYDRKLVGTWHRSSTAVCTGLCLVRRCKTVSGAWRVTCG